MVGGFEFALALAFGSGEGSTFVAEEFAFQQGFRYGGTVNGNVVPRTPAEACISLARTSLPVPLSPDSSTVVLTGAIRAAFIIRSVMDLLL